MIRPIKETHYEAPIQLLCPRFSRDTLSSSSADRKLSKSHFSDVMAPIVSHAILMQTNENSFASNWLIFKNARMLFPIQQAICRLTNIQMIGFIVLTASNNY